MLRPRRASYRLTLTAVFAAMYFVLGTLPVFPLATGGFLRANKVLAPLVGMLLGPFLGGASMVLGSFLFVAFSGQPSILPLGPIPLDFVPDATVAMIAGLAYTRRQKEALALPTIVLLAFYLDPISVKFVVSGGVAIPFAWMLLLFLLCMAGAFVLARYRRLSEKGIVFMVAVVFASLLTGQLAGTLVGQSLSVGLGTLSQAAWNGKVSTWPWGFFYTYPFERAIYAGASVLIGYPVLRAIERRTIAKGSG